jgi:hypothetical protein
MNFNKYLEDFKVPKVFQLWIQYSLILGVGLDKLLKSVELLVNEKNQKQLHNAIELLISSSKLRPISFTYGNQEWLIQDGELVSLNEEEDI